MAIQTSELPPENDSTSDAPSSVKGMTKAQLAQRVEELEKQMNSRKTREVEETHPTREDETRASDDWTPPALLDAPPPREGMVQRWVTTSILGEEVPHHTMKRFREGWQPRPADTVPKDFPIPTIQHGQFEGFIGVEGSLLCEIPEERVAARTKYFKKKTGELSQFADQGLEQTAAKGGIPIDKEVTTKVSFGKKQISND